MNQTDKNNMVRAIRLAHELKSITGETDPVEIREAVAMLAPCRMAEGDSDINALGYRFIRADDIDDIMQGELKDDLYILGCFNASFLAGILDISEEAIQQFQAAEAFEGIGELIISGGHLEELQQDYASADGYGHHFNRYDGNEEQLTAVPYYAFKVG